MPRREGTARDVGRGLQCIFQPRKICSCIIIEKEKEAIKRLTLGQASTAVITTSGEMNRRQEVATQF